MTFGFFPHSHSAIIIIMQVHAQPSAAHRPQADTTAERGTDDTTRPHRTRTPHSATHRAESRRGLPNILPVAARTLSTARAHTMAHTQEARATRHDRRPDTIEYTTCSSPPPCVQANLFALRCVVAPEMHTSNVCARARPREPSRHPLSVCRGSSTTCSVACEHVVLPAQAGRRLRRGFHRSEDWPFAVVVVVGHRIVIQRASVGDLSVN